jgi:galactokinase
VIDFPDRECHGDPKKLMRLLADRDRLAGALAEMGLSSNAAGQKAGLFGAAAAALRAVGARPRAGDVSAYFVPGRIEVLGKHTDYAGGRSMVAAAERGFCVVVWPRADLQVNVTDAMRGETASFRLDPELTPRADHWSNYPMTVARRIARNFPEARHGADIAFASDVPPAAGMSSSSAMVVAVFSALADANRLWALPEHRAMFDDPLQLAGYLGCIENGQSFGSLAGDRGVGTFGGSEDHTAMLCAEPGKISQFAYCPVRLEQAAPVPADYTFAIGSSGVVAEKSGAAREKYNRASRFTSTLVELWRHETGRDDRTLAAALGSSPDAPARLRQFIAALKPDAPAREGPRSSLACASGFNNAAVEFDAAALLNRLEHFIIENEEIVPAAGRALGNGDISAFGRLVDRSQQAAAELLGNQVPETIYLAASARRLGAAAASAFGAGFGGSVWALMKKSDADVFLAAWAADYRRHFPQHADAATFFATAAGPARFRVC